MQIEILTDKGTPITLVRFFMLDEKQFLIYSDNSEGADDQGHVTIHISEIVNSGRVTANAVSDQDWESIKSIIKSIVNANKNNQPLPVQDLDYNALDGISIIGERALKLMGNYVELLKVNQPVYEKSIVEDIIKPAEEVVTNPAIEPAPQVQGFQQFNDINRVEPVINNPVENNLNSQTNYEQLYNEQLTINEQLKNEIMNYKNKIESLKNIINN